MRSFAGSGRRARAAYSLLLRVRRAALSCCACCWRGRAEPLYATAIGERFGRYRARRAAGRALDPCRLARRDARRGAADRRAARRRGPGLRLLLTHGTATGRAAGRELLREGDLQAWLPWDTPGGVRRFLAHFRAGRRRADGDRDLAEPAGRRAGARPADGARQRAPQRAQPAARRAGSMRLLRPAFESLARRLRADRGRCRAPARRRRRARSSSPATSSSTSRPKPALIERGRALEGGARRPRRCVLARGHARRRGGEPARRLARAGRAAAAARRRAAPSAALRRRRRADRRGRLRAVAAQRLGRRAAARGAATADVWLGDSMRRDAACYALADVALLGGSFAPLGGQNLIEAAACGCPVVMGPHTFNFADAAELALAAGAAVRVADHRGRRGRGAGAAGGTASAPAARRRRPGVRRGAPRRGRAHGRSASLRRLAPAASAASEAGALRRAAAQRPDLRAVREDLGVERCARRSAGGRRARP